MFDAFEKYLRSWTPDFDEELSLPVQQSHKRLYGNGSHLRSLLSSFDQQLRKLLAKFKKD